MSPRRRQVEYQALGFTTDFIWDVLHGNDQNNSSSGETLGKTAEMFFSKTCVKFRCCYGNERWPEAVENKFLI